MTSQLKTLGGLVTLGLMLGVASADENKAFKVPEKPYKIKIEHHKDEEIVCERRFAKGVVGPFPICCEGKAQFACFIEEAVDAMVELKNSEVRGDEPPPCGTLAEQAAIYRHKLLMNRLTEIEKHIEREDYNHMFETLWGISLEDIHQHVEKTKSYPDTRKWLKEQVCE
jgi:hypothetical protein